MRLNAIFGSHMVFAAGQPIRIYGNGEGNASITFGGITKNIRSQSDYWMVEFPPMIHGGPYELKFSTDEETVLLSDIYIGEVYLFAGQSNMQFKLNESTFPREKYTSDERLRLFSTERIEKTDVFTPKDGWVKCRSDEIGNWSAIAYLTSKKIAEIKNVAVGIIVCYQGGSVIESWVPAGTFEKIGIELSDEEKHFDHFSSDFSEWNMNGALYEQCFSQVVPYPLSAVIWYQGESDTSPAEASIYGKELSEMIKVWRSDLKNDELPFVIVQIADFLPRYDDAWHKLQDEQLKIQDTLPYVKTVISADVCEIDHIHPPTKTALSARIAKALTE